MSDENKTPEVKKAWYYFFTADSHEPVQHVSDEEAIKAGQEKEGTLYVLRARDTHKIWEKALAILILATLLLCGGNAKAQILGGGTNLVGSATTAVATNIFALSIPPITVQIGNATNPASLFVANELLAIGPTNANPVFVTNNGYVYVVVASTNYQYSANAGTNGTTLVFPQLQAVPQQIVTGFQAVTGTNNINVYAHF